LRRQMRREALTSRPKLVGKPLFSISSN
jgi:hypothetical protein